MDKFVAIRNDSNFFSGFDGSGNPVMVEHPADAMKFAHKDEVAQYLGTIGVERAGWLVSTCRMAEVRRAGDDAR